MSTGNYWYFSFFLYMSFRDFKILSFTAKHILIYFLILIELRLQKMSFNDNYDERHIIYLNLNIVSVILSYYISFLEKKKMKIPRFAIINIISGMFRLDIIFYFFTINPRNKSYIISFFFLTQWSKFLLFFLRNHHTPPPLPHQSLPVPYFFSNGCKIVSTLWKKNSKQVLLLLLTINTLLIQPDLIQNRCIQLFLYIK